MKIIPFYKNERQIIKKAIDGNREAQKTLYAKHAPKMLGVCRQYIKDIHFAEDVMIQGFVKMFKHLESFKFEGSFEGWVRRIMIRESISFLRKQQFVVYDDEVFENNQSTNSEQISDLDTEHIQQLIDALPQGYKMVFVLYTIEGYKHQEIADMLDISESTSKTQLFKARKILKENLEKQNIIGYGTR
ncbi:RNA polymerase sigma factor [Maribacter cobaltidurans]|uniref:RNA polymerase subunit sigma-70 n=1 Tax=Maribacter cobaltidurans TaxID=1178778 RepID=A0A223V6V2_9FLAO|nr:RNA polymerase sigma factor [Maribacter cobaltidurans]ASV31131.1 RNA polymerase subunit sigma-70 [Maribacter cobaltidurans]GGD95369.1 DNA-directed RNA polymerase sigma-70 factor [Maribacter cobaltidurans]